MSHWEKRIREHRVWSLMESLGPAIDKAIQLKDLEQDAREALERLRAVLTVGGKRIGAADPLTIVPGTLDIIAQYLANEQAQVDAFAADRNIAHLTDANASADSVLLQLHQLPSVCTSEELIEMVRVISRYRSDIDAAAQEWTKAVRKGQVDITALEAALGVTNQEMQTTVAELKSQLENERQKIGVLAAESQKLFNDAQEARSNTYTETLRKTQESLNKTLNDQQGQFSTAQENRGAQFSTALTDMQKRFGDLTADYTKRLADQDAAFTKERDAFSLDVKNQLAQVDADYRKSADEILGEVKKRQREVETLVGVIGSLGVTSGYQKTANSAKHSMWIWQAVAVAAMLGVIVFAWYAFVPTLQGGFHWSGFAARVFLTITVGVLAAYAAAQADRFFHIERQHRRLALELAAIDPFIALLPLEEQQKFKLEIGRRSFAQEDANGTAPAAKSPATTLDMLIGNKEGQRALENFAQILSKIKA